MAAPTANLNNRPYPLKDANGTQIPDSWEWQAFQGDYTGTNLIYRGFARPGTATSVAKWQIAKMTYDGSSNLTAIQWPQNTAGHASNDYQFIWDNRASLTYS